jgi:hypothetical protein
MSFPKPNTPVNKKRIIYFAGDSATAREAAWAKLYFLRQQKSQKYKRDLNSLFHRFHFLVLQKWKKEKFFVLHHFEEE